MATQQTRIGRLEGIVEQVDKRLESIDSQLGEIRTNMGVQFRWMMGTTVGAAIVILAAIITSLVTTLTAIR